MIRISSNPEIVHSRFEVVRPTIHVHMTPSANEDPGPDIGGFDWDVPSRPSSSILQLLSPKDDRKRGKIMYYDFGVLLVSPLQPWHIYNTHLG